MDTSQKLASAVLLVLSVLFFLTTTAIRVCARNRSLFSSHSPIRRWKAASSPITEGDKKKRRPAHTHTRPLSRAEMKDAEARLSEMGYGTGRVDGVIDGVTRNALIAFQKYEGRKVTGQLSRADFDAIMNASAPQARD